MSDGQHLRADLTVVLKPKAWGDVGVERVVVGRGRPWQDNPFGVDFEKAKPSAWRRSAVKSRLSSEERSRSSMARSWGL